MNKHICHYCKQDYTNTKDNEFIVMEITIMDYTNVICHNCRVLLLEKMKRLAIEFLC